MKIDDIFKNKDISLIKLGNVIDLTSSIKVIPNFVNIWHRLISEFDKYIMEQLINLKTLIRLPLSFLVSLNIKSQYVNIILNKFEWYELVFVIKFNELVFLGNQNINSMSKREDIKLSSFDNWVVKSRNDFIVTSIIS